MKNMNIGQEMYQLAKRLYPICRSITGEGVRKTLNILKEQVPQMSILEVASGTTVFDWTVPQEWLIRDAYIEFNGEKIIDFNKNNLHVIGYSIPVDKWVDLEELKKLLYVQDDQPEAIPYITSYYKERYGFCMSKNQKDSLKPGLYHIVIDSELKKGVLNYGEILIPGDEKKEIFLSTYVCHPSMANNELSGPCVAIFLAKWLLSLNKRRYSYRIIFIPETIGAITYLSFNLEDLKKKMIAGFNLTCVGDDRTYSYVSTRYGNTLADKVAKNVLHFKYPNYNSYSFLQRGSDERQYDAPGVDLPVCAICRSKYHEYPEYHTSLDNMGLISASGLFGAYDAVQQAIIVLENNYKWRVKCLCEPQLGKRGLYPTISQKGTYNTVVTQGNFIAYADGTNDLIDISNIIMVRAVDLLPIVDNLLKNDLIEQA